MKPKSKRHLPQKLRLYVLYRDHYVCRDCGATYGDTGGRFEIHHVIPVSEGGKDSPENLVTLCSGCHVKRHQQMELISEKKRGRVPRRK